MSVAPNHSVKTSIKLSLSPDPLFVIGNGYQHGIDGELGIELEGGLFGGPGYSGFYFGGGVGLELPTPFGYGFYGTDTTTLWSN